MLLTFDWILTIVSCPAALFFCSLANADAPRKRRSRWGDAKAQDIPGLPTAISANGVSQAQLDNYAIHLRLEEINRKLRLNNYVPPEKERYAYLPPSRILMVSLTRKCSGRLHHLRPTMPMVGELTHVRSAIVKSSRTNASNWLIVP